MKYILIGPVYPYKGGISHFTTALAKTLNEQQIDLTVISFKRQYPKFLYPGKCDKDPSKEKFSVEADYIIDSINLLSWYKTLKYIQSLNPILVIVQWWNTYWAPLTFYLTYNLYRSGINTLGIVHNVYSHESAFCDVLISKISLRYINHFIVFSPQEEIKLRKMFPKAAIDVYPLPMFNFFSNSSFDKNMCKKKIGISSQSFVLLFFGIIRKYKGLRNILRAIPIVKTVIPNIKLVIAGEFWENIEMYKNLISSLDLWENVIIDNRYIPNEEIPKFFSAADIFLAPYEKGTQSGAVTIAISYNLPIITTKKIADGLGENRYSNIFTITENDPISIAKKIIVIYNNYPLNINEKFGDSDWNKFAQLILPK
mgnify:CR=1 FL=1